MSIVDRVEKLANWKGMAALLFLIFLGIFVARNFDFITDVTFHIAKPGGDVEAEPVPSTPDSAAMVALDIAEVDICRFSGTLPCHFYLKVQNRAKLRSPPIAVVVDFGRATVDAYEFKPKFERQTELDSLRSTLRFSQESLGAGQTLELYALISGPSFETISLLSSRYLLEQLSFRRFEETREDGANGLPGWAAFLQIVAVGCAAFFMIWAVLVLIRKLNQALNMEW